MLFNEARPQKDEPEPEDSGSSESNQHHAKARQGSELDGVSSTEGSDNGWWHMIFDGVASQEGA